MKRQILILVLACAMIFGVLSFAGCNKELKNQVNDLQAQVNELQNQANKNASDLEKAIQDLAKQISDQKTQVGKDIEDLQKDIQDEKDARADEIDALKETDAVSKTPWDFTTEEMNVLQKRLAEKRANHWNEMVASRLYLQEEYEELVNCQNVALWRLSRATSPENAEEVLAMFDEEVAAIKPVPQQIYEELMENYIGKLITYLMREDLLSIKDHYDRWIALDVTPEYYDEYLAEKEIVLDPTFAAVATEFVDVIMPRSDMLEDAVEEAEAINERLVALKAVVNKAAPSKVEENWETKEAIKADIRAWINEYFFECFYRLVETDEGEEETFYDFELPGDTYPEGTINYQLIDHALYQENVDALYVFMDLYTAASRKFIASVAQIDDPESLLAGGMVDTANAALGELMALRGMSDYEFVDDGVVVVPDCSDVKAEYETKKAGYTSFIKAAYDAYEEIVPRDFHNNSTERDESSLMKRAAEYYCYTLKTGDTYHYATTKALSYFMSTTEEYPTYNMDALLAWYDTYGVWDEEGNIVWDTTYYTDWTWADDFNSMDAVEIAEAAVPVEEAKVEETGYMLTNTGIGFDPSWVWTVAKVGETDGKQYSAVLTNKLTADDYAIVTGYDKRTVEIAAEALYQITEIVPGKAKTALEEPITEYSVPVLVDTIGVFDADMDAWKLPTSGIKVEKYQTKAALLLELLAGMYNTAADYADVQTDLDDYHIKMIAIEMLNTYGLNLETQFLADDADVVTTKAIRKLLIDFVNDINTACPAADADAKSAVTTGIQDTIVITVKHAEAAFDAVVDINDLYEEALTGDEEVDAKLFNKFRVYVCGEEAEVQEADSWIRKYVLNDGFEFADEDTYVIDENGVVYEIERELALTELLNSELYNFLGVDRAVVEADQWFVDITSGI